MGEIIIVSPGKTCGYSYPVCKKFFSYICDGVCSILSGALKFCLAHGLRQLTHGVKYDVRILNFRSAVTFAHPRKTPNGVRKRSLCDVKCH